MFVRLLQRFGPARNAVFKAGLERGRLCANDVEPSLKKSDKILDIGTSSGHVAYELRQRGYKVRTVDVVDLSFVPDLHPEIVDGKTLPYPDKSFDVALLLTVLHHATNPNEVIAEAQRVAKRIIIIEDIYDTRFQKYRTYVLDSILNLEFFGHPHSNRTDEAWQAHFKKVGMKIESVRYIQSTGGMLRHAIYTLKT